MHSLYLLLMAKVQAERLLSDIPPLTRALEGLPLQTAARCCRCPCVQAIKHTWRTRSHAAAGVDTATDPPHWCRA